MRLGKVYKDLSLSDYQYEFKRFIFTFSSKFYIMKFERELLSYIKYNTDSLINKYGIYLEADEYLALSLYKKIEKRGFQVLFDNKFIEPNETFLISLSFPK